MRNGEEMMRERSNIRKDLFGNVYIIKTKGAKLKCPFCGSNNCCFIKPLARAGKHHPIRFGSLYQCAVCKRTFNVITKEHTWKFDMLLKSSIR
jgi:transposase-like protein